MSFMFRCCCRPFLKGGDDGSRPYYDQLGVDRECSTEDIKRAYKKKSLELHPDKLAQRGQVLTVEDQSRFQRVKEAYEVLVDPKRRDLYDEFGETGLKLIEDPQSMDPQTAFSNFMRSSSYDRCAIFSTLVGVTAFVLLWPVLLCLQADKTIHIPWTAIWTPLWVCDAFLLFILWFMVFLGRRSPAEGLEEEWRDDLPARVLNAVQLSCNVLFQVFLTLKLDKVVPWDWSRIFAPWLAWEGIQLFRNLTVTSTGGGPTPFATSAEEGVLLRAMAVRQAMLGLQHGVLRIVFCALAILRLDEKIRVTWWVVFTPLWLFFATQFVGICVEYALAKRLQEGLIAAAIATAAERGGSVVDPETGEVELGPEEAMIQEQTELMASRASMLACQAAIVLVMALLGVARIEGAHFSVFLVFLPVFVIVGCFTCSLGCAVCCVRDADGVVDGENRPLNPGARGQGTASATSIGTNPSVAASMVRDSREGHVEAGSGGPQQDLSEGRSSSHKTGSKVREEGGTPYRPPAPLPSSSQGGPKTASGNDSQGWGGGAGEEIGGID